MDRLMRNLEKMFSFENVKWDVLLDETIATLYMTGLATLFTFIIGLMLGIILFLTDRSRLRINRIFYLITSFLVNTFRAVPFIILIILLLPFTNILMGTIMGAKGALPALIVSAAPFYARLVEIGLKEIDKGVIEAAFSMGANIWELILKVLIPESLPALISGITVTAIMLVGATAIAGVIGAGGLGSLAYNMGHSRGNPDVILVSTIAILVIVFLIQFIGDFLTRAVDKR